MISFAPRQELPEQRCPRLVRGFPLAVVGKQELSYLQAFSFGRMELPGGGWGTAKGFELSLCPSSDELISRRAPPL